MPTLLQNVISGGGPVEWQLFSTVHEFCQDVDYFFQKAAGAPFIGVAIHLCADGTLDAMALSANDYAVVLNSPAALAAETRRRKGQTQNGPLTRLLGGECGRLAGFGMAQLAMHMRKAFGTHAKGFDISNSIPAKKTQSPGQLLKDFVDLNADSHSLDTLWDVSPQDQDDDPKRFNSLILRAWLSAKYGIFIILLFDKSYNIELALVGCR